MRDTPNERLTEFMSEHPDFIKRKLPARRFDLCQGLKVRQKSLFILPVNTIFMIEVKNTFSFPDLLSKFLPLPGISMSEQFPVPLKTAKNH